MRESGMDEGEIEKMRASFSDLFAKGGFVNALTFCERLSVRVEELQGQVHEWRHKLKGARAVHLDVFHLAREFGEHSEIGDARGSTSNVALEGELEWVDAPQQCMLHVYPPVDLASYPLLTVPSTQTWAEAIEGSARALQKLEVTEASLFREMEDTHNRETVLRGMLDEYERTGTLSGLSGGDAPRHEDLGHGIEEHYDTRHPYEPFKAWFRSEYDRVRPESRSDAAAREAVQAAFDLQFSELMRQRYGKEMLPSDPTIRRALGEL